MKEIIIIGLAVLFVYFAYGASQSGKNALNIQPASSIPENVPTEIVGSLPETRVIVGDKYPVASRHETAEQYHAPTVWGYWDGTRVIAEGESPVTRVYEPAEQYYAVITEEIIEEEVIP